MAGKVFIKKFAGIEDGQTVRIGKNHWSVARLIVLAKDLEVFSVPVRGLNVYLPYDGLTLRDMVMHFNAVKAADLSYPIILDEDGELMDGRHRIIKAMMQGRKTLKAVRFDINPPPCWRDNDS